MVDTGRRRYSLFSIVIVLPFTIAILCAVYAAYSVKMRARASTAFSKSVDNETNTKYSTGIEELVAAYGPEKAAEIISESARSSDSIAFDGVSRFVKIVHRTKEWEDDRDPSKSDYTDGIILQDFSNAVSAVWDGPKGTRISSVRFENDNLVVSLHGKLELGNRTKIVPKDTPEDFVITWNKGAAPTFGSLYDFISANHEIDRK